MSVAVITGAAVMTSTAVPSTLDAWAPVARTAATTRLVGASATVIRADVSLAAAVPEAPVGSNVSAWSRTAS